MDAFQPQEQQCGNTVRAVAKLPWLTAKSKQGAEGAKWRPYKPDSLKCFDFPSKI